MADIDSLVIKINSNADSAISNIGKLTSVLSHLSSSLKEMDGISSVEQLVNAISSLNKAGSGSDRASGGIANLSISLGMLADAAKEASGIGTVLKSIGEGLASINMSKSTTNNMLDLSIGIEQLGEIVGTVDNSKIEKVVTLGEALKGFNIGSTKNLDNLGDKLKNIISSLDGLTTEKVENFKTLAESMEKINGVKVNLPKLPSESESQSAKGLGEWLKNAYTSSKELYGELRRVFKIFANLINQSTRYGETINLFNESMKPFSQQAFETAELFTDKLGLNISDWMEYQGVFMSLANGFGVASDRAYTMSQQLTQLTYDLSSFFNTDTTTMAQKVQSAFAGELEPVRRLGYDLSQAQLKAVALELGITKSFDAMTQGEKAQLRYYALMTQLEYVQGDLGKTLNSSANQIRVFQNQITLLARSIGNIFIPMLNAVLPYLTAFAKMLRGIADMIASFFGFKLPEVSDWGNNASDSIGSLADNLDDATGSAKKLKKQLAGFDEINNLTTNQPSSGGISAGGSGWVDFELPTYDFLKYFEESADQILSKVKEIAGIIAAIGVGIATTAIIASFPNILSKISNILITIFCLVGDFFTKPGGGLQLTNIAGLIIGIIATLVTLYATCEPFRNFVDGLWNDYIKPFFLGVWEGIKNIGSAIVDFYNSYLKPVVDKIWSVVSWLFNLISTTVGVVIATIVILASNLFEVLWSLVKPFWIAIQGIFEGILTIAKPVFIAIGNYFKEWWENIKKLGTLIISVFESVMNAVKPILNFIIGAVEGMINGLLSGLNLFVRQINKINFDIPSWVPVLGGKKFGFNIREVSKVSLPRLAEGGIATTSTIANIGEAGKEAIVPLERNTGWMNDLASKVAVQTDGMSNRDTNSILNNIYALLTNMELSPEVNVTDVIDAINKQSRIKGKSVLV